MEGRAGEPEVPEQAHPKDIGVAGFALHCPSGVLLPVIIFFMLKITSDKTIMGAHVNSRGFNIVAWSDAIITASISIIMVVMTLIQ